MIVYPLWIKISIVLGVAGAVLYMRESILGRVSIRTKWKDLNWYQWACIVSAHQLAAVLIVSLIVLAVKSAM